MSRPNILFFLTDDQRFDTIRALGCPDYHTPVMDALVARGTAFTHACIPGGSCGAVCMPSRAMLHTGRTLYHIDGCGETVPDSHALLGETLRRAGYHTFGTGKWHNGAPAFNRSFASGDDIFFGGMEDHWNVPAFHYDPTGAYATRLPRCRNPWNSAELEWKNADHIRAGTHSTDLFADATIRFIDGYDRSEPFFAYLSFMAPHDPRTMPDRFRALHDPAATALPDNFLGGHPFPTGALAIRDELLAAFPRDPVEIRRHIAEYRAMIAHLDEAMGRVLDALRHRGMLDNTVIVLAGDNGLAVGQHGLMGKQSAYDHSVRVPLVFAGPGIPEGARTEAFAYLLDIFPTLCDLCGLPVPGTVEGASLVPAMRRPGSSPRECVYLNYERTIRAVRTSTHKLIEYAAQGQRHTQLFDLARDPLERDNRAADPAAAPLIQELRRQMLGLRDAWGDLDGPCGRAFWPHMEWAAEA